MAYIWLTFIVIIFFLENFSIIAVKSDMYIVAFGACGLLLCALIVNTCFAIPPRSY